MAGKPPPLRSGIVVDKLPEAVKFARITNGTRYWPDDFAIRGLASEQHAEICRTAQAAFGLTADSALETSRIGCSLAHPASAWARAFDKCGIALSVTSRTGRDWEYAELQDICMQRFGARVSGAPLSERSDSISEIPSWPTATIGSAARARLFSILSGRLPPLRPPAILAKESLTARLSIWKFVCPAIAAVLGAFASVALVLLIFSMRPPVEPSPVARATLQPPEIGTSAISARAVIDASESDEAPHATT